MPGWRPDEDGGLNKRLKPKGRINLNKKDQTLSTGVLVLIAIVIAVGAMLAAALLLSSGDRALGDGGPDSPEECKTTDATTVDGVATFTAPAGEIVTGVCIKSGNDAFAGGADPKHSGLLTVNGTYGINDCFVVSGIGTATVSVTIRTGAVGCHAVSHLDVNTDPAPTPTVNKVVVNDDGGTAVVGDFTLRVDGGAVTSGVANTVSAGAHVVSEADPGAGYTATIGGDCDASGNVTLAAGENKTCTMTNDDVPPTTTPTPTPSPTPATTTAVLGETQAPAALPTTGGAPEGSGLGNLPLLLALSGLAFLGGAGALAAVAIRRRR